MTAWAMNAKAWTAPTSEILPSDREAMPVTRSPGLMYPTLIALGCHGLFVFGLGFNLSLNPDTLPSLEITLATHHSQSAPEEADFLAQHNQLGSGSAEEAEPMTAETQAQFIANQVEPVFEVQQQHAQEQLSEHHVLTTDDAFDQREQRTNAYQDTQKYSDGDASEDLPLTEKVATLRAQIDKQRQEYANRPRIRVLTSVSTQAADDAQYLYEWSQQVEWVGNQNYPKRALEKGIHGQLRLLAVIDVAGTLLKADVLESSGYPLLDDAALNIVHKAAPYAPFPPSIRKDTDQIEIIRTWFFEISGFSTR